MMKSDFTKMPGRKAPAFLRPAAAAIALAAMLSPVAQAAAQTPPGLSAPPPISAQPVPSEIELVKLIWSTVIAVDQGNRSGNYSVMRDLSATGFQINNDAASLAQIFAGLRASRIDLSNALLVAPSYTSAPQLIQADVFRVTGVFALRPTAIYFDLYYQWEQGRWKLFGIDMAPQPMATQLPGAPAAQPATQNTSSNGNRRRN